MRGRVRSAQPDATQGQGLAAGEVSPTDYGPPATAGTVSCTCWPRSTWSPDAFTTGSGAASGTAHYAAGARRTATAVAVLDPGGSGVPARRLGHLTALAVRPLSKPAAVNRHACEVRGRHVAASGGVWRCTVCRSGGAGVGRVAVGVASSDPPAGRWAEWMSCGAPTGMGGVGRLLA